MLTVADLARQLACYPPDTPLAMLSVSRVGACVDVVASTVATTQASIDDRGQFPVIWLIGAEEASTAPPAIIAWPCSCGDLVTVIPNHAWPDDNHPDHPDPSHTG